MDSIKRTLLMNKGHVTVHLIVKSTFVNGYFWMRDISKVPCRIPRFKKKKKKRKKKTTLRKNGLLKYRIAWRKLVWAKQTRNWSAELVKNILLTSVVCGEEPPLHLWKDFIESKALLLNLRHLQRIFEDVASLTTKR